MKIENYLNVSPVFAVLQASQALNQQINRRLERENVNFLQALILISIHFEDSKEARPSELASVFGTTRANVSHSITSLQKKKLVERISVKKDARGYGIKVTPVGQRAVSRLVRYFDGVQRSIEEEFTEAGVQELITRVGLLKKKLNSKPGQH